MKGEQLLLRHFADVYLTSFYYSIYTLFYLKRLVIDVTLNENSHCQTHLCPGLKARKSLFPKKKIVY